MTATFLDDLIVCDVGACKQNHASNRIGEKRSGAASERLKVTDVVAAAFDGANHAEVRSAWAGRWVDVEDIVETVADDGLRLAPQVGYDGRNAFVFAVWQRLELERNDIFLNVERPLSATYGQ